MHFNRKRYTMCAFDGKIIYTMVIDFPEECLGTKYDYLNQYASECYKFAGTVLYEEIKDSYISACNKGTPFGKFSYKLDIKETYSSEHIFSYLITVTLEAGGRLLSHKIDTAVFRDDMIIPPKLLGVRKGAALINSDGNPCQAIYNNGTVELLTCAKRKLSKI